MKHIIDVLDRALEQTARVFKVIANLCLLAMLLLTATTIVIRPFNISIVWLWPWSMQVFVWMTFIGFFYVYRYKKDIAVDFVMRRIGPKAMVFSRYFAALMAMLVTFVILIEMPRLLSSQVAVIDGVRMPGGWELRRYTLTWPLAVSSALVFLNAAVEIGRALTGHPERSGIISGDE